MFNNTVLQFINEPQSENLPKHKYILSLDDI